MKFGTIAASILAFAAPFSFGQRALVTNAIDETELVSLTGNTSSAAIAKFDQGRVNPNMALDHMLLQLKRSPEQEEAVKSSIDDLHNPKSANFHKWMSAQEFGEHFGASEQDVQQVSMWLRSHGLEVESVNPARTVIQFSGKAAQVEEAFHTEIHTLNVNGVPHFSNVSAPQIPKALSGIILGTPINDFKPHPLVTGLRSVRRDPKTGRYIQVGKAGPGAIPSLTATSDGTTLQLVGPQDFATIYNLNPAWHAGYRGKGQTVVVIEDSFMKPADVTTFRREFGLSGYAGTYTQTVPAGSHPCMNPGITANEGEAALDAEWAGATAPDSNIVMAACADTRTQFGGLIAMLNLLSQKTPPPIMSLSYGECEAEMGTIALKQFYYAYQQAAAEGVSVFVAAGDDGAAGCDDHAAYAVNGVATSGFASTPYNVTVGGTDFYDTAQGTQNNYWAATNGTGFSSALSYIPEKTWNDSCADSDLMAFEGATEAYGAQGFCNNYPGSNFTTTAGASGGRSFVYAKPSWQSGVYGLPNDGSRDIPDVSLFAANGLWNHALLFCDSDPKSYGAPCTYEIPADDVYDSAGGTSFASPALAGIFALITQKYGPQGNPNYGLYQLAATEYGTPSAPNSANLSSCNSTKGNAVASSCTFYDVTQGNIAVPCAGSVNCYGSSAGPYGSFVYGVLSESDSTVEPAYPTSSGWDFATGLGSINATNLLNNWSQVIQ